MQAVFRPVSHRPLAFSRPPARFTSADNPISPEQRCRRTVVQSRSGRGHGTENLVSRKRTAQHVVPRFFGSFVVSANCKVPTGSKLVALMARGALGWDIAR